jgi:hypothetical protein
MPWLAGGERGLELPSCMKPFYGVQASVVSSDVWLVGAYVSDQSADV